MGGCLTILRFFITSKQNIYRFKTLKKISLLAYIYFCDKLPSGHLVLPIWSKFGKLIYTKIIPANPFQAKIPSS